MLRDTRLREDMLYKQWNWCVNTHRRCTYPSQPPYNQPIEGEGLNTFPSFFVLFGSGDYYFITPRRTVIPRSVACNVGMRAQKAVEAAY
jgi:hypothetical protein